MSTPTLPSTEPPMPSAPESRPPRELDRSLVTGVAWTAGVKWSVQLIVWVSTFVVIRLLSPSDYGTMGMAGLFVGLIQMLSEFGVGTAVVTLHRLKADHLAQLNGLALLFGVAGGLVVAAAAVPLGWFFATPALPAVIATLGTGFIISAFGVVPAALLTRDMEFKRVALYGGAQALVASVATLILAAMGLAYWSLVFGNLVGAALFSALVMRSRPVGFRRPRRSSLGDALNLSTNVIVGRVSWYVYSNADFLTIGRVLGQAALGVYTVGWTLATMAVDKITATLGQVTPSIFSAAQNDPAALRRYLCRITEALAVVTFPICVGLALVATPVTEVLLGPKWLAVATPLRILAIFGTLRSITSFLTQILNVVGDSFFPMVLGVISAILFPAAFYVGSRWGIEGVAYTWLILYPLICVPLYRRVMTRIQLTMREYMTALWPALSASTAMTIVVLGVEALVPSSVAALWQLVIPVLAGAAVYVVVILGLHRARLQSFRAVATGSFGKERDAEIPAASPAAI